MTKLRIILGVIVFFGAGIACKTQDNSKTKSDSVSSLQINSSPSDYSNDTDIPVEQSGEETAYYQSNDEKSKCTCEIRCYDDNNGRNAPFGVYKIYTFNPDEKIEGDQCLDFPDTKDYEARRIICGAKGWAYRKSVWSTVISMFSCKPSN